MPKETAGVKSSRYTVCRAQTTKEGGKKWLNRVSFTFEIARRIQHVPDPRKCRKAKKKLLYILSLTTTRRCAATRRLGETDANQSEMKPVLVIWFIATNVETKATMRES